MAKGLICGIQKFSVEDGPGIRTNVFLKGCPLRCSWCHNPEMCKKEQELYYSPNRCISCMSCINVCPEDALSQNCEGHIIVDRNKCIVCGKCVEVCHAKALKFVANEMTAEEIIKEVKRDMAFYKNSGGGMTLSGGEILANADFSIELAERSKDEGISVALETSGYGRYNDLLELLRISDYILFDIKSIDSDLHKLYTGVGNEKILQNLSRLCKVEKLRNKIIIRMPLISEINDSYQEITNTAKFIKSIGLNKIDFLPYHELGIAKAMCVGEKQEKFETPSDEYLISLANSARELGIEVNIMGVEELINGEDLNENSNTGRFREHIYKDCSCRFR